MCGEQEIDQVVVVDTGGAATVAPDLSSRVRLLRTDNRGYGAAANSGFTAVPDAPAVLLLNDDAVVLPGAVEPLVAALADPQVGAVQPMLVDGDHATVTSRGVAIDRYGAGSDLGEGEPVASAGVDGELEIFTGGAVVLDRGFLRDTGGFDESYFLYYEDVDLARRGRALGWRYRLVPAALVEHERGTTTGRHADLTRFHQERNRLWSTVRFESPPTVLRAVGLSLRRLRHEPRRVHRRALAAGLAGSSRRLVDRIRRRRRVNV